MKNTTIKHILFSVLAAAVLLCAFTLSTTQAQAAEGHSHCVCGGEGFDNHSCETAEYVPLESGCYETYNYTDSTGAAKSITKSLKSGNYYLSGDYSFSGTIYIVPGAKVNLCLNGYKLTTTGRSIAVNGELTICDCDGDGQIYSRYTGNCPTVYTGSGGKYTIYGGTFSAVASSTHEFGGCFGLSNDLIMQDCDPDGDGTVDTTKKAASAYIYGGRFIGTDLNSTDGSPSVTGSGACGFVAGSCTLYIYGGEFEGARAVLPQDGGTGGGGIIANAAGTTYIYGGKFSGSTDSQGAIWTNNSKLHIAGNPVFENNNNADIFLHYSDHLYVDGALTNETPIRIAGSVDNYTKIHLSCAEDLQHLTGGHDLVMGTPDASNIVKFTRANNRSYCECGGTLSAEAKAISGHVCANKTWQTLCQGNMKDRFTTTSTTSGVTSTARYYLKSKEVWLYLSGNVNLTNEIEISEGYTLHIDLNGYTITHSTGSNAMFRVHGKLTICDTYGGGKAVGIRTGTSNAEAACAYALNYNATAQELYAPEISLYSGTLTGYNITSNTNRTRVVSNQGGVIQIGNNSGNKSAVFKMYGGTVRDGMSNQGGNILVGHGAMYMYGGLITGGTAINETSGKSAYGGNIRLSGGNVLKIYGGEISNGLTAGASASYGGNIYMSGGTMEIQNATLSGGCGQHGGNLYVNAGEAALTNTTLKGGKAGFAFTRNADGTVSHSTTDAPGGNAGNLFINEATVNVTDCTFENGLAQGKNSANGFGGHIYNRDTLIMSGSTLSGGSGFRGGAIGIRDSSSNGRSCTELTDCTFTNHSASILGNTISSWTDKNGCDIIIENCSFDDSANTKGHVIGLDNAAANTNPVNLTVKNSSITAGAGNAIWCDWGTVTLEGNVTVSETLTGVNLSAAAATIVADNFTPEKPISVVATTTEIGTSATDKSDCFTHETKAVAWADGTLYLTGWLQGRNGNYKSIASAVAAGESYVKLIDNHTGDAEITGTLYLDLNGKTYTGNITGTGTLCGMDSAGNDYTSDNLGRITGTVSCELAEHCRDASTKKRYLAIEDETGYTFHRFYMGITHIHLKPGAGGVGYKAAFYGDEQVLEQVAGYGYILKLGADGKELAAGKEGKFESGKTVTARLQNFDVANYGETPVYGKVYLTLNSGTTIESSEYSYVLRDMVEQVAENASSYTESQLSALRNMLLRFEEAVSGWNLEGIM